MKAKLTIHDEVWCNFSGLTDDHLQQLYTKFGVFVEGYRWILAFKLRRWDGKKHFFELNGQTNVTFLDEVIPILVGWGYELDIVDKRMYQEFPTNDIILQVFEEFAALGINLRDYQKEIVTVMVESGQGMVTAATGSGKSIVTAALAAIYGKMGIKTLTIVPSSDLVTQTYAWFIKCGLDAGQYSGGPKEISKQHVVATWQSLQNHPELVSMEHCSLQEGDEPILKQRFGYVLVDEIHQGTAAVLQSLMNDHGRNIQFRFGLTGTQPKDKVSQYLLKGSLGNILKEVPAKWLIDHGYLAEIEIEVIQTIEPVDEEFPDYASEKSFIIRSPERLEFLANLAISKCEKYGNTLVLVNSVSFGKKMADMIEGAVFLSGASEKEIRRLNYDLFETKDDLIVIATFGIAGTGLSIDRVFHLMLVDTGKSFSKVIQAAGRGLRKAHDKNKVFITDISAYLKYCKKHLKLRTKYYTEAEYPFNKKAIKVKV